MIERRKFLSLLGGACVLGPFGASAQQPAVTRMLVGATPGGSTDIVARGLANEMSRLTGRQMVVENRPGAAGNIAAQLTANAAPDGGTLLISYTSHVINPSLYPSLPFDPINDFTPLCGLASSPAILVARPSFKANRIDELIALAKAQPGKLNIAIAGIGSANHLAGEMLKKDAGIDIVSVSYKGTGPALTDVVAGHIDLAFAGVATVQELIKAGKLKALAVTSNVRLQAYPEVPTIAEVIPGYAYSSWYGLFGPAHMQAQVQAYFSNAAQQALRTETLHNRFISEGLVPMSLDQQAFETFVKDEIQRWKKVVIATGTKAE